jgi:hypothetical protein
MDFASTHSLYPPNQIVYCHLFMGGGKTDESKTRSNKLSFDEFRAAAVEADNSTHSSVYPPPL